jgi:hypothetical protein
VTLTREQIEEWRACLSRMYAGEFSNMAQIETLCDMALSSLPSGATKTVPVEPTGVMLGLIAGEGTNDPPLLTRDQALIVYRAVLAAAPGDNAGQHGDDVIERRAMVCDAEADDLERLYGESEPRAVSQRGSARAIRALKEDSAALNRDVPLPSSEAVSGDAVLQHSALTHHCPECGLGNHQHTVNCARGAHDPIQHDGYCHCLATADRCNYPRCPAGRAGEPEPSCNGSQQESQKLTGDAAGETPTPRTDAFSNVIAAQGTAKPAWYEFARGLERESSSLKAQLEGFRKALLDAAKVNKNFEWKKKHRMAIDSAQEKAS